MVGNVLGNILFIVNCYLIMVYGDYLKYSGKFKVGKKIFLCLILYVVCDWWLLIVIGVLIVISIVVNFIGLYMFCLIINDYILLGDF